MSIIMLLANLIYQTMGVPYFKSGLGQDGRGNTRWESTLWYRWHIIYMKFDDIENITKQLKQLRKKEAFDELKRIKKAYKK